MNKIREIFSNKWFKFTTVSLLYLLTFVVWSQIWWSIIGLVVIYDLYISKLYYRLFWERHLNLKDRNSAYRGIMGWVEAILYAVVVASLIRIYFVEMYVIPSPSMEKTLLVGDYLGVSKVAYGPKLPNTPISIPFVHNINPFNANKKSYVEWLKRPYQRLCGFDTVKHNDVVVFNYPEGDTVMVSSPQENYYIYKQIYGKDAILQQTEIMAHPVDKRDNYIKRAVGLPGDILTIVNGDLMINGKPSTFEITGKQRQYYIRHKPAGLSSYMFEKMGVDASDHSMINEGMTLAYLTEENANLLRENPEVIEVLIKVNDGRVVDTRVFPRDTAYYKWTEDNFGPLWIPRKGESVALNETTLPLYRRVIEVYEGNDLRVANGDIYINGEKRESYTFKMNYFFMMGDNRDNSFDSRFFGFVPEDHIVGKASFIWFSKAQGGSLFEGIRFNRIFTKIK